jgi:hypothetical protein
MDPFVKQKFVALLVEVPLNTIQTRLWSCVGFGVGAWLLACPTTPTFQLFLWCTPRLLDELNYESKDENNGKRRSWSALPGSQHFEGEWAC